MKKKEFLEKLDKELQDLSKEERASALKYYEDYFEDAGDESEEEVIKKLGTPSSVAESIKKDNTKNNSFEEKQPSKTKESKTALIILAVLFFCTIGAPILIALLSAAFGLVVGLIGVFIGFICAGFGILISGIAVLVFGIITVFNSLPGGLLLIGISMILLGFGAILTMLSIKLCTVAVPAIIRGVVKLCKLPFRNRGV